ncbi:MAG: tryptophan--tRNA ligase, partial [Patescibacteria group bacterium]
VALAYLSLGIDLEKTTLFKQSDVPEHTELAWIFDCITTMPYLMRAHAFKDAEAKNKEISVGTFNYPMLMAADILLYQTNMVPVGGDQKQHVEYAKNTAEKFHRLFGQVFSLPEARILSHVGIVLGTDGRKMSKSYGNTISLFASKEEIGRAVMGMVTDSSGDRPENVYALHALLKPKETLEKLYGENKGNYKALKEALVEDLESFIAPLREKREAFASDRSKVLETLKEGGARAREKANETMKTVRDLIGVNL